MSDQVMGRFLEPTTKPVIDWNKPMCYVQRDFIDIGKPEAHTSVENENRYHDIGNGDALSSKSKSRDNEKAAA